MEKHVLVLKIGNRYNICDRMIFNLIQCGIQEGREISNVLDLFPYEYLAESLARLHNNGLIFMDTGTGKCRLSSEVKKIADIYNEGKFISANGRDSLAGYGQLMQNFNGTKKVFL